MPTRRLFVITLAVLFLHAVGWRLASGGTRRFEATRPGVRLLATVSVRTGAQVPFAVVPSGAPSPSPVLLPSPPAPREPADHPGRHPTARASPAAARTRPPAARVPVPAPVPAPMPVPVLTPAPVPPPRPLAGDGGRSRPRPRPADEWPVYATRPPGSITLRYALAQRTSAVASGPTAGEATLEWVNAGDAFVLRLATAVEGRGPREWQSTGGFDAAGVAPWRLVERERGRDKRSVNFDRDAGRVRFSGAPGALRTVAGAQDRWSWVAQLAAIAEADAGHGRLSGPWHLQVAGLRGDLERWTFRVQPASAPPPELAARGNELSKTGDRAPALLHVLRAPERPYDLRIEAWLSPSLHHFPAGLRLSTPPGQWSLTLWQVGA